MSLTAVLLLQGIAQIVKNVHGPRRAKRGREAEPTETSTAANAAGAAHFETSKWPSILVVLASLLAMSPHEEYLPDVQACGPVRSAVITALFLTLELFFELTRREFSESCL